MKNLGTFLSIISIVVGITACEKSPEDIFDMSAIPGQYKGYISLYAPDSSSLDGWSWVRRIAESYYARDIYSIQKVKENQYTLTFGITDTILPNKITFEISWFEEESYDVIDAHIKLVEDDIWQLSHVPFHGGYVPFLGYGGFHNQFRYIDLQGDHRMIFDLVLKRKDRDDITISCHGYR